MAMKKSIIIAGLLLYIRSLLAKTNGGICTLELDVAASTIGRIEDCATTHSCHVNWTSVKGKVRIVSINH